MKTCLQNLDYAFQIPLQKVKIYLVKFELPVQFNGLLVFQSGVNMMRDESAQSVI